MRKQCTWADNGKRCEGDGVHEQLSDTGKVWAVLCDDHDKRLNDALGDSEDFSPRVALSVWVKASGGAKQMVGGKQ